MKNMRNEQMNKQSKQNVANTPNPEIRDNLDSRKKKEPGYVKENDETNKSEKKRFEKNGE